jgi:glycosyltransferase involved in cell wall biosynthesis
MDKLTVLIGTHNEGTYVYTLLSELVAYRRTCPFTFSIVVVDDNSTDSVTLEAFNAFSSELILYTRALNGHYGNHKTYMNSVCTTDWVLNLDADERISEDLFCSLGDIIDLNPAYDGFAFPRINLVDGLTVEYAKHRWPVTGLDAYTKSERCPLPDSLYELLQTYRLIVSETADDIVYRVPLVAWPDYQLRLYKLNPSVKWVNPVHEQLVGLTKAMPLPAELEYALLHKKTIDRQKGQNELYDKILNRR